MKQFFESRNGPGVVTKAEVFVALGANLPGPDGGPPLETLRNAIQRLDRLPGIRVARVSRWYRTAPVPAGDQPDYVNAVVALRVGSDDGVDPAWLLDQLMTIELEHGRQRGAANAARTLDLDVVAIGGLVRDAPDPILPHPRAHLRRFVMAPLADVAPDWVHPVLGETAAAILARLPEDGVTALEP